MHANFIENAGGATSADAIALMAEARRRAREQFGVELEHEVAVLGGCGCPRRGGHHPAGAFGTKSLQTVTRASVACRRGTGVPLGRVGGTARLA